MPYIYKPFFCTLLPMFMQQASAVCVILFYAQDIFEDAGTSISADDCTIIVGALQVVVLFVATALADRLGRKVLLIVSSVGSIASLTLLGISFHLKATRGQEFLDSYGWLPLVAIAIYFMSYATGLGPLPWVLLGGNDSAQGQRLRHGFLHGVPVCAGLSGHQMLRRLGDAHDSGGHLLDVCGSSRRLASFIHIFCAGNQRQKPRRDRAHIRQDRLVSLTRHHGQRRRNEHEWESLKDFDS
ncbi:hypothetical protein MTO96_006326 [Rhipicephalus appendiculatus]